MNSAIRLRRPLSAFRHPQTLRVRLMSQRAMRGSASSQPRYTLPQLRQGTDVRDFRELRVWQRAHELAVGVYKATVAFPRDETYGLRSQIRRAAGSIPANIAEGCGKRLPRDQARHCQIAMGSACELEYHLLLAKDVGILPEGDWTQLNEGVVAVKQMLTGLIRRLITDGGRRTADGGRRTA